MTVGHRLRDHGDYAMATRFMEDLKGHFQAVCFVSFVFVFPQTGFKAVSF